MAKTTELERRGEFDKAATLYKSYLSGHPKSGTVWFYLADLYKMAGRKQRAEKVLNEGLVKGAYTRRELDDYIHRRGAWREMSETDATRAVEKVYDEGYRAKVTKMPDGSTMVEVVPRK